MSETEKEPESPLSAAEGEPASPKNQLVALLTLLPVLGVLWLVMQYLPKLGDWMGDKAESVVGAATVGENSDSKADASVEAAPQENSTDTVATPPSESGRPASIDSEASSHALVSESSAEKAGLKAQIIEQLGGSNNVEVRHLAISDDSERMVAALKINDDSGAGGLVEVFFDRDEFGRFISSGDSPVPEKLVLWSE